MRHELVAVSQYDSERWSIVRLAWAVWPGARLSLSKPARLRDGCGTPGVCGTPMYSCGTSDPARSPTFFTATATVNPRARIAPYVLCGAVVPQPKVNNRG